MVYQVTVFRNSFVVNAFVKVESEWYIYHVERVIEKFAQSFVHSDDDSCFIPRTAKS